MMIAQMSQRPADRTDPPTWDFDIQYGPKGQITNIRAVPVGQG
jgi:hypothetical protein